MDPAGMAPLTAAPTPHTIVALSVDGLSIPHHVSHVVRTAVEHTTESCLIIVFSDVFDHSRDTLSHTGTWDAVQRLLTFLYVQATSIAQEKDTVLMDIDVLLRGFQQTLDVPQRAWGCLFRVDGDTVSLPLPSAICSLNAVLLPPHSHDPATDQVLLTVQSTSSDPNVPPGPSEYPTVALGGTFDHLHAGHKILLSMAAWITGEKIIVGVTDDALLQRKTNKEVLETLPKRMDRVRAFLSLFKPGLVYDIVPINDVYGPTGSDPNIQALVVSKETLSGASSIAKRRAELSLPELRCFVIDVISATNASLDHEDEEALKKAKMSSTFIRDWIVRRRQGKDD